MDRRLLLAALILFLVPFTGGFASPPEVRFDLVLIESFGGVGYTYSRPVELPVTTVEASSYLSDRYSPSNLIDGDKTTAWIEGVQGYGLGEKVKLKVPGAPRVIGIWPGYQRSEAIYLRNGRPARIRLAFVGNDPEEGDPYYDIFSYEVDLFRGWGGKIAMQPQYIYIGADDIVFNMALDSLEYIEIEILAVDSSDATDPDMGISEVRLYVEGDVVGVHIDGDW